MTEDIESRIRDIMNRLCNAQGMARAARLCLERAESEAGANESVCADIIAAAGVLEELEAVLLQSVHHLDPIDLKRAVQDLQGVREAFDTFSVEHTFAAKPPLHAVQS